MKVIPQKGLKKADYNDKYILTLKQLHIESIIQKGKLSTLNFPNTEKPTLYDYLLDKHALLYENQNDEKAKQQNNQNQQQKNKKFFIFDFSFKNKNNQANKDQNTKPELATPAHNGIPESKSKFSNTQKTDLVRKVSKNHSFRSSNSKKSTSIMDKKKSSNDEYLEVSFYNEKYNQRQYYKVCVVPLLLQEPLLAISMEDITFVSLYHQRMQQTKKTLNLASLSYVKLKQKIDDIIFQISNDQPKLKKDILYLSHIIRSFTRIDTSKIQYTSFSVSQMIDEIKQLFPCITKVRYKNDSNIPITFERKETKDTAKLTIHELNYYNTPKLLYHNSNISNNQNQNVFSPQLNPSPINHNLTQNHISPRQNHHSPNLYPYIPNLNINNPNNSNTNINKNEINNVNMYTQNMSLNLDFCNDIDQIILSDSNAYILNEEHVNTNNAVKTINNIIHQRNIKRRMSQQIPISQQCKTLQKINSFNNLVYNNEQNNQKDKLFLTTENTPYSKFVSSDKDIKEKLLSVDNGNFSSRCRLNSNFTANNNTDESLLEKNINEKVYSITNTNTNINTNTHTNTNYNTITNTIFSISKKSSNLTNSQKKFGAISEILGIVEEKIKRESESQITEETLQEFIIYNNKNMIHYVLVGIISMFKEKKIELIISLNQSNLYKSLKIQIMPLFKLTLSRRLTYFQPESLYNVEDIYNLKAQDDEINFNQLADKLFQRLNEICLLLGPNKIKQEPDLIEIEFFIEKNNLKTEN